MVKVQIRIDIPTVVRIMSVMGAGIRVAVVKVRVIMVLIRRVWLIEVSNEN